MDLDFGQKRKRKHRNHEKNQDYIVKFVPGAVAKMKFKRKI